MRSSVYYTIEAFPLCFISILGFGVGAALKKKAPMHFLNPVLPRSDVGKPYKINMDCWLRFKQSRDSNLQNQWACEPVFQSGLALKEEPKVAKKTSVQFAHNSSKDVRLQPHFRDVNG